MFETQEKTPKVILASVDTGEYNNEYSMSELVNLSETANLEVVAQVIQKREKIDNALYLGKGRLEEIKTLGENLEAQIVVIDDELTGSQMKNIEDFTGLQVLDRTTLILDIFATNAMSKEGKIQVELAQYRYRLPRLVGFGAQMSRLGGAMSSVGARGPGETKLETDRRHINNRITKLKEELEKIEKQRENTRRQRSKAEVPTIAIVGYTNVGKSTFLNALTDAQVLEENKLFATLDPTARQFVLPNNRQVVFIDTVGFISRLPHHLVEAFKSTLEVAKYADLILVMTDVTTDYFYEQLKVTDEILKEIGCEDIPKLYAVNKCDMVEDDFDAMKKLHSLPKAIKISAKKKIGLEKLVEAIEDAFEESLTAIEVLLPYSEGNLLHFLKEQGQILEEDYKEEGIFLRAKVDKKYRFKFENFLVGKE